MAIVQQTDGCVEAMMPQVATIYENASAMLAMPG